MNLPKIIIESRFWSKYVRSGRLTKHLFFLQYFGHYRRWKKKFSEKLECVIYVAESNGLCDRINAFISVFSLCKKLNVPLKFQFVKPIDIRLFLEPNKYDWTIDEVAEGTYESLNFCESELDFIDSLYMNRLLKERIEKANVKHIFIRSFQRLGQLHGNYSFSELFHELFRPTKLVQERLDYYKNILVGGGVAYISVSSRFAGLIGDFDETWNQPLPENEREILLKKCLDQVEILHQKHPDRKILICSDSITFLKMASKLEYVFVAEGTPIHTSKNKQNNVEDHLKTFVDFFLISEAEKVYLLQSGDMYPSGFPRTAAMVNDRPFEIVRF